MNILAIGAHPDDIEFGCGGTLIKYAQKGDSVYLLVLTMGGVGADPRIRKKEQELAVKFIKAEKLFWGNFQDTQLEANKQLISAIEEKIDKIKPQIVLFNYINDIHRDHRITAQAGTWASRYAKEVLCYEIPTSQNFQPDIFVDIQDTLKRKLKLLKIHASQMDKARVESLTILESARASAIFRGYQGRVKYAEGFKAIRIMKEI